MLASIASALGLSKKPADELVKAVDLATRHAGATRSVLDSATKRANATHARHERAEAAERGARARFDAVCLDRPNDERALRTAQAVVDRARDELTAGRSAAIAADASTATAATATATAEDELLAARRALKVHELSVLASITTLRAELAPHVERFLELELERDELLKNMDRAHAASCDNSRQLRELGEGTVDAAGLHLLAPFILRRVAEEPGAAGPILNYIRELAHSLEPSLYTSGKGSEIQVGCLAEHRLEDTLVFMRNQAPRTVAPELQAQYQGDLEAALGARNLQDAIEVLKSREAAREAAASKASLATYETPANCYLLSQERP